jgi:hypothetical protein
MLKEIMLIKDQVEKVLSEDVRARNDDNWLIIQVLREMGYKIYIDYKDLDKMPAWETIRRTRQKFQEEGKYPATEECQRKRRKQEVEMQDINKVWNENDPDEDINRCI